MWMFEQIIVGLAALLLACGVGEAVTWRGWYKLLSIIPATLFWACLDLYKQLQ